MPLVRIDAPEECTSDDLAGMAEGVHQALVETIGIPISDRFQVISRHAPNGLIFDPEYLGIQRSSAVVFIQITISVGRTLDQKRALYASIARNLSETPGMRPEDVFINLLEIGKENWSFGNGVAQYAS